MVRTTVVGSWPPPFGQRPALRPFWQGDIDETDPQIASALGSAARIAMDEMIACGLDQIMGGEVFAPDFVHHVPPRLSGLRERQRRDMTQGYQGVARYEIAGPISAPRGTGHAAAFRRERAIEPSLHKVSVPSPLTMAIAFPTDPRLAEHMDDLVEVVSTEVAAMVGDGATEVQLDAPSEAIAVADGLNTAEYLVDQMVAPFDGLEPIITRTVHFCLGDISRKPATQEQNLRTLLPLIQAAEGRVDRIHLECSYAGQWAEHGLLADVPSSMEVIAGIADVKQAPAHEADLRSKIDALVAVIPEDRLLVSSSCGCGRVPHDDAIRLMRNLVKAAS